MLNFFIKDSFGKCAQIWSYLILDLLISSEDIIDKKTRCKNLFFEDFWLIKIIVFMELRITGKVVVIFALALEEYLSKFCDSPEK